MARTPLFRLFVRTLRQAHRSNLKAQGMAQPRPRSRSLQPSRRRFLKLSALAGGAAIATLATDRLQPQAAWGKTQPRIAVVGGGIAGLNAAYQLKKLGLTATVYEGKPILGGRIQSRRAVDDGLVNEVGGSFINTNHADILALTQEFGLELFNFAEAVEASPLQDAAFYADGRSIPAAELADWLQPLAAQMAADSALLDQDFEQYAPQFDRLSVTDYLNQHVDKIPQPFVRVLVENSVRTEYGVEPNQSSALQLLFLLPAVENGQIDVISSSDETYLIKAGNSQLISALSDVLSGQIQTCKRLASIHSQAASLRLTFSDFSSVEADYVIMAIPFQVLRHVDIQVELPTQLQRFIHEVDLGHNEKLFAGFRERCWLQTSGFVGEAWTDCEYAAIWDDTARQSDTSQGALTFFLGGDQVEAANAELADRQGQQYLRELDSVIPGIAGAATGRFFRSSWAKDIFVGGGYTSFKPGQYSEFSEFLYVESDDPEERQDVQVGHLVFAGEHLSSDFYGYMNGGAQTGRLAAEAVASLVHAAAATPARAQ
ncbi:MAG: FAD-dependent oxidoreductase [Cyanobacteria bacterium Co-bin13]|nr:FAD-dependent oxidoreductase [Cyanobacteria bacterium Co-bin13]